MSALASQADEEAGISNKAELKNNAMIAKYFTGQRYLFFVIADALPLAVKTNVSGFLLLLIL